MKHITPVLSQQVILTCALLISLLSTTVMHGQRTNAQVTPVGTVQTIGKIGNSITIELKVQGPSAQETPLQVACLFEYTEGDIFNSPPALPRNFNGMIHLDEALHGLITNLRKNGRFKGHALETLLLTPPAGTIPAKRLLLIGLGDRAMFTPDLMERVATVGFREAARLGVNSFSHASDLKDGGVDSPTAEVAGKLIEGLAAAYQTQMYLGQHGVSPVLPVRIVTILTGPAFFETTKQGAIDALDNLATK